MLSRSSEESWSTHIPRVFECASNAARIPDCAHVENMMLTCASSLLARSNNIGWQSAFRIDPGTGRFESPGPVYRADHGGRDRDPTAPVLQGDPQGDVANHRPRRGRLVGTQAPRPGDFRATLFRRNPELLHRRWARKAGDRRPLLPGSEILGIPREERKARAGHVRFLREDQLVQR